MDDERHSCYLYRYCTPMQQYMSTTREWTQRRSSVTTSSDNWKVHLQKRHHELIVQMKETNLRNAPRLHNELLSEIGQRSGIVERWDFSADGKKMWGSERPLSSRHSIGRFLVHLPSILFAALLRFVCPTAGIMVREELQFWNKKDLVSKYIFGYLAQCLSIGLKEMRQ